MWVMITAAALLGVALVVIGVLTVGQMRQLGEIGQPEMAEQLLASARDAREQGQLARAAELYEQAAAADPKLALAYTEGSGVLVRLDETGAAMALLQRGVTANPDDLALRERLAALAMAAEQWDVARSEVDWLLQQAPDDPLPHAYSAIIVLAQGGPCEEALPELELALELDPRLPWAHYGMALCHVEREDVDAARAELEMVLSHDRTPSFLRARAERLLERLGAPRENPVEREFEALFQQVERVPERDNLRAEFGGIVDEAGAAWGAGDRDSSLRVLDDARGWVEAHWDDLGPPLAEELISRLERLIDLISQP
jgi:Tfp pilus assembly protein PilF